MLVCGAREAIERLVTHFLGKPVSELLVTASCSILSWIAISKLGHYMLQAR